MAETSTKKRKRTTNGTSTTPSAKKAVHFKETPITVSLSASDPQQPSVIVAYTPGSEPASDLTFAAYSRAKRKRAKLLLHSATHPRLDYTAPAVSKDSVRGRETQYIGVYDQEANTLELFPAEAVVVKSTLKKTFADARIAGPEKDAENGAETRANYGEKRTALGEAFGTKKAKKALKSAVANAVATPVASGDGTGQVSITTAMEGVMQSVVEAEGIEGTSREAFKTLAEEAHPRPRPNLEAEVPTDVYKLTRLIKREELEMVDITGWKNAIAGGTNIKTQSRFVGRRVLAIGEQKDDRKLKGLKYLYALILWIKALDLKSNGSAKLPQKDKMLELMPGIGSDVRESIRRRFAPAGQFLSPWDKSKVMLYACAMAITLDDCNTDVHDLQEDLKLTNKEIKNYYKELGCKLEEKDEQQYASLRLPFQLPEVRQRRVVRR